jgi:hypothetical protein
MLVVECGNKRIAVFNGELHMERFLLSSKDQESMYAGVPKLCFLGQSGQLAVAASRSIHLYLLRKPTKAYKRRPVVRRQCEIDPVLGL